MSRIIPIVMPKWGLSMQEGKVNEWLVEVGRRIEVGMAIVDVETDKLANAVEAPDAGLLRRQVALAGDVLPVKALLGVLADEAVGESEIDAYIAAYEVPAADDDDNGDSTPAFEYIDVNGIALRYRQLGSGALTVLLIHGFGGDLNNWLFNMDELARQNTVIALDLPAHGGSAIRLPETADIAGLADLVLNFLDALGQQQVAVLAHSMGGAIAAQMALAAPERISRLALVSPCGAGSDINMDYINGFIQAQSRRDLKPVLGLLLADADGVSRAMVDDTLKYKRLDGVEAALHRLQAAVFTDGRQADLPVLRLNPLQQPLLVLWGENDHIIPAAQAAAIPAGAAVHTFAQSGHMCHMDQAAQVNPLLLAFFQAA